MFNAEADHDGVQWRWIPFAFRFFLLLFFFGWMCHADEMMYWWISPHNCLLTLPVQMCLVFFLDFFNFFFPTDF